MCWKKRWKQTEALEEQIELEGQLEGEQKEVLRGPDDKPLLNDILTGGYTIERENNNQEQGEEVVEDPQFDDNQQNVEDQQKYMDDQQYVLKKVKIQMIMHMNKNIMSQININMRGRRC